jgi:hypothetical protein
VSINALIVDIRQIKRPCRCCKRHPADSAQKNKGHPSSIAEFSDVFARSTKSRRLSTSLLPAVGGLQTSMRVTDTKYDRQYVSSLHLQVLSKMVISIDLMIRWRSWGSLSLTGSSLTWRNLVQRDSEFMIASARGDIVTMQRLMTGRRANPFDVCAGNITTLTLAIESGVVDAVKLLLDCGMDANDVFGMKQTSPLAWALKMRFLDVARLLMERGASFHHLSLWGWSPLFYLWSRTTRHRHPQNTSSCFVQVTTFHGCIKVSWTRTGGP